MSLYAVFRIEVWSLQCTRASVGAAPSVTACTPSTPLQSKQHIHDGGGLAPGMLCDDDYVVQDVVQEGSQCRAGLCVHIA